MNRVTAHLFSKFIEEIQWLAPTAGARAQPRSDHGHHEKPEGDLLGGEAVVLCPARLDKGHTVLTTNSRLFHSDSIYFRKYAKERSEAEA